MKIKWGVIGCGGIADRRTIPGIMLSENSSLEIVMDLNGGLCKTVGEKYGVKYTTDIDEVLKSDVDAVYIATPVFCHKEQAIKAARAKKHILLEKPMGLTCEEAEEIMDVCRSEGVKLTVGLMMRYHAHHAEIKRLIEQGTIGDIVSMRAQFTCWYPDIDGVWRQNKKLSGGGALMDLGVHCIDLLNFISGDVPKSVSAVCSTQTFSYNVDDTASVIMKMAKGAHAFVDVNFNIPDDATAGKLEFYGTRGSIISTATLAQEETGKTTVTISEPGGYDAMQNRTELKSYELAPGGDNIYKKEIDAFTDAIVNDKPVVIKPEEALLVQRTCEAAYESSETGKRVDLK